MWTHLVVLGQMKRMLAGTKQLSRPISSCFWRITWAGMLKSWQQISSVFWTFVLQFQLNIVFVYSCLNGLFFVCCFLVFFPGDPYMFFNIPSLIFFLVFPVWNKYCMCSLGHILRPKALNRSISSWGASTNMTCSSGPGKLWNCRILCTFSSKRTAIKPAHHFTMSLLLLGCIPSCMPWTKFVIVCSGRQLKVVYALTPAYTRARWTRTSSGGRPISPGAFHHVCFRWEHCRDTWCTFRWSGPVPNSSLGGLLCAKIAMVKREEMCGSWWDAGGVWKKHAVDRVCICTLCFFAVFLAHFGLPIVSNFDPNPWTWKTVRWT